MNWKDIRTIPQLIKKFREYKNLSQTELAKKLNMDPARISQYENKSRFPPIDTIIKILEFLEIEIKIKSVFGTWKLTESPKSGEKVRLNPSNNTAPSIFDGLPDDEISDINAYIDRRKDRYN